MTMTPATRDCPICRGAGCAHCGSGELDDREVNTTARKSWPKHQPRARIVKEPGRARTLRILGDRSDGLCERCGGPGHSTHHLKNRSQGGPWSPSNCVRLCGSGLSRCHGWVTLNPVEAGKEGFHLEPWEVPGTRPIHSALHGVVLLADDGSLTPAPIEGGVA